MMKDNSLKPVVEKTILVQSLLALREEMVERSNFEIVYKINSCLYDQYPANFKGR